MKFPTYRQPEHPDLGPWYKADGLTFFSDIKATEVFFEKALEELKEADKLNPTPIMFTGESGKKEFEKALRDYGKSLLEDGK